MLRDFRAFRDLEALVEADFTISRSAGITTFIFCARLADFGPLATAISIPAVSSRAA